MLGEFVYPLEHTAAQNIPASPEATVNRSVRVIEAFVLRWILRHSLQCVHIMIQGLILGILPLLSFWSRGFTSKTISEKDDMLVRERSSVDDALTETAKVARRNTLRPVGERRRLPCYNRSILLR